jgi:hypothetical protein
MTRFSLAQLALGFFLGLAVAPVAFVHHAAVRSSGADVPAGTGAAAQPSLFSQVKPYTIPNTPGVPLRD